MSQQIDHYSLEPNLTALKRAMDVFDSDPAQALPQLTYLAERGSPISMLYIGHAYRDGTGVAKDAVQTEEWYRRAADKGSILGLYHLGRLYIEQRRYEEAKQAFRFAAAAGYTPAVHHLGRMYFFGLGVEKDIRKATTLLGDASASGNVIATRLLGHVLIRTHLSVAELLRGILLTGRAFVDFFVVLCFEGPNSDRFR